MTHVVESGDCMASLGAQYGFFWKTLWDLPDNSGLNAKRKNPNVLFAGDEVVIPEKTVKQESRASGAKYKFILKGVPEKLRFRLLDADHKPRANLNYTIVIDGKSRPGTTDGNGELVESIDPAAKGGKLIIQPAPIPGKPTPPVEVIPLKLGHLDPISETSGIQARLANLKFYKGPINGNSDAATEAAIRAFQTKQKLQVTGKVDDATTAQLQKLHGH